MVRILVLGASGFIGHEVALALSRHGHIVLAQTRSEETGKKLQAEELTPVVQDPSKFASWITQYADVDVIIDSIGGDDIASGIPQRVEEGIAFAEKQRPHGPALTYIATSGTWVHGNSRDKQRTEGDILGNQIDLTKWRTGYERRLASHSSISFRGIVVRPSILYGRTGSLTSMMFATASQGSTIEWYGEPGGWIGTIHTEDLGEIYAKIVEKANVLGGVILDAESYTESVDAVLQEVKRMSGAKAIEFKKPTNAFESALATSQQLRPTLARDLLDWHPRKAPLAIGMQVYYDAYLASK